MQKLICFSILLAALTSCSKNHNVKNIGIYTSLGNIELILYPELAPITANYFIENAERKVFDNKAFYRGVKMSNQPENEIKIEVIQGGIGFFESDNNEVSIQHESTLFTGLKHIDGTISMARNDTGTASTEFFICIGEQPELDYGGQRNPDGFGFSAFGKVISGMDVVHKIHMQPDTNQFYTKPITIDSIRVF